MKQTLRKIKPILWIYRQWKDAVFRKSQTQSFKRDFSIFQKISNRTNQRFTLEWEDRYPCLDDKTQTTGFDSHYIYHVGWAARVLSHTNPAHHTDIGSALYFTSVLSAFVPVHFYDYRPAHLWLPGIVLGCVNLTSLPFSDKSIYSLSCMHTIEHVGLGRYGDPLDPDGDLKAIAELKRVLALGGSLLFVVPVGKPKIMFNAHRIYLYEQIIRYFADLELQEFALVPDDASNYGLISHAPKELADAQNYGCGCFWFIRK